MASAIGSICFKLRSAAKSAMLILNGITDVLSIKDTANKASSSVLSFFIFYEGTKTVTIQ